jgi:hypothetical protein
MLQAEAAGDFDAEYDSAGRAAELGRRFADGDLVAMSLDA